MLFNFGDKPFNFPPESDYGYTPLSKAQNLIEGKSVTVCYLCSKKVLNAHNLSSECPITVILGFSESSK